MRNRLILAMVAVVALILAVHDIPLARHLEIVERDRLITQYERDAFIIGGQAEEDLDHGTAADSTNLASIVETYAAANGVEVVIADANAEAVVISDSSKAGLDMSNRPEFSDVLSTATPVVGERYSRTLDTNLFYVSVPVVSGERIVGVVRISAPSGTVSSRVNGQIRGLLLVAFISLGIAGFVAWLMATGFSRPVLSLRRATDRFAAGDLNARAPDVDGAPEFKELTRSFNAMATQLEHLVDRQRRFAGDASHQLRTPLTALRLQLEQLQDSIADRDTSVTDTTSSSDQSPAEVLDAAVAETDRLRTMVEGLLTLSRAEQLNTATVAIDVATIARERVDHWEPLAAEHGVDLVVEGAQSAIADAVPGALPQIIDNLIDNALDVAPARSTVRVRIEVGETDIVLHVIDDGPGLSAEQRDRAFERFWRARDASPGGTGLGLAIVQQLVETGGGRCCLAESERGGIDATVVLPRAKTGQPHGD